jgi:hypothetical protein
MIISTYNLLPLHIESDSIKSTAGMELFCFNASYVEDK